MNWRALDRIVLLMFRHPGVCCVCGGPLRRLARRDSCADVPSLRCKVLFSLMLATLLGGAAPASAVVLWSDLGATLVHETGAGSDILGGALKRDDSSTDTLYFKFHVDALSDVGTEEYFAGFQLYEGDVERLAVGNSLKAYAYSAFNTAATTTPPPPSLSSTLLVNDSTGLGIRLGIKLPESIVARIVR